MNAESSAAEREIVKKLARGSLLSRLKASRQPLKLVAVPRDHVTGDRNRGEALLAGKFSVGSESLSLIDLDFQEVAGRDVISEQLESFSWLRDLAAAASREKGARLAEAILGRWLIAHGSRIDQAWAPHLWGERILYWTAYAPYILSSGDGGYRSALLNTLARGARHLDGNADKAPPGLKRVTAWCGVVAAGLLVQGGVPRVARGEAGLARALAGAQFEDGGLVSRSPFEQLLLVDRLGLLRSCYFAAKQTVPEGIETASAASLAALHGITLGDGALSSWQGCNPGEPSRLTALVEGCGLRARPLRNARGWGYQRMSALGTVLVLDAAEDRGAGVGLDARVRNVRRRAAADRQLRRAWTASHRPSRRAGRRPAHHRRAQHARPRRHQLDQHPARRIARQGRGGRHHRPQRGQ
jgi:uncharacterized heparinase superfamily protein